MRWRADTTCDSPTRPLAHIPWPRLSAGIYSFLRVPFVHCAPPLVIKADELEDGVHAHTCRRLTKHSCNPSQSGIHTYMHTEERRLTQLRSTRPTNPRHATPSIYPPPHPSIQVSTAWIARWSATTLQCDPSRGKRDDSLLRAGYLQRFFFTFQCSCCMDRLSSCASVISS